MARGARSRGRVVIVDDDPGARALIGTVLAAAGFKTTEVANGEAALELIRGDPPDAVVLDVHLPGASGYAVCRTLRDELGDEIGVLFVSGERVESFDRVAGLLLGGDDYLVKPFAPDELVARVHSLLRRAPRRPNGLASRLTARELEVLALLAEGLDAQKIAPRLVISPKTVATHIEHILAKLGVHSRAQAVALAYRQDLTPTGRR